MGAGQFLILGVPGIVLDDKTRALYERVQPGGFILFGRNVSQHLQLRHLIDDLRSTVRHEPVITIDQEGGRVSRLKELGSEPPSAKQLRDQGDIDLIIRHGMLTGKLLRLFGFNLDLCPVLDVSFDDEADNSLKNRTYGLTPEQVSTNAGAFNHALRTEGILSCGKHFPGYSAAGLDPHHDLPVIDRTQEELEGCEWKPYRQLLPYLDAIMVGHLRNGHLDPSGLPTSLSPRVVRGLLREEFQYRGIIMTDDIDMGAIVNRYGTGEAARLAMVAGHDYILLCHQVHKAEEAVRAIETLADDVLVEAAQRVTELRHWLAPPEAFSWEHFKALDAEVYQLRVDTLGAEKAAERSVDDGKRSPVETF